jgi:chorismate mutase
MNVVERQDEIEALRRRIEAVDDAILGLLAARAELVSELWTHKRAAGVDVHDPEREEIVFARLRVAAATSGLDPEAVDEVFRSIVGRPLR